MYICLRNPSLLLIRFNVPVSIELRILSSIKGTWFIEGHIFRASCTVADTLHHAKHQHLMLVLLVLAHYDRGHLVRWMRGLLRC